MDEFSVIAYCFDCHTPHDVSDTGPEDWGMTCDCGGTVITPTGEMRFEFTERRYECV